MAWNSNGQDVSGWGVYAQRYDGSGGRVGAEFRLNTTTSGDQYSAAGESVLQSVAGLPGGGFVAVWGSNPGDASTWGVVAQRFDADGRMAGTEIAVNTYTNSEQRDPSVAVLADGGFVVTWMSYGQDGDSWGVYAQMFDAAGSRQGNEFRINTSTTNQQVLTEVTGLTGGGFVVTWLDAASALAYAQLFDASGAKVGSAFSLNAFTGDWWDVCSTAPATDGGFWGTWKSDGQDGSGYGIYAQHFSATGAKLGFEIRVNTTVLTADEAAALIVERLIG